MGWQDVIGSVLTAGATGDPLAWKKNKMQEMLQKTHMEQMMQQLEMQKNMHALEKQKIEMAIKAAESDDTIMGDLLKKGEVAATPGTPEQQVTTPTAPPYEGNFDFGSMFSGQQNPSEPMVGAEQQTIPATPGTPASFDRNKLMAGLTVRQAKVLEPFLKEWFGDKKPVVVAKGGSIYDPVTQTWIANPNPELEKPVNQAQWIDSLGIKKFGDRYNTVAGQNEFARWMADPKNEKEINDYQLGYSQRNTPPGITYLATGTGYVPMPNKGPGVPTTGKPVEGLGKPISIEATTELAGLKNTYDRLGSVEQKIKTMGKQWGPIEGRWQKIKLKFMNDGPTQEVMNEVSSLITMAYGLSGKQISYQEMEMLKSAMLPQMTQPKQNLLATINFARKWVGSSHNDRLGYFKEGGYSTNIKPIKMGGIHDFTHINKDYTEENLAHTAKQHGITVDEVEKQLGLK